MDAYAAGADLYFSDPHGGVDALYREGGAEPALALRVVRLTPPPEVRYGDMRVVADTATFDIRRADVAAPLAGDTLEVAGVVHRIQGAPILDATGTVWHVDAAR